MLDGKYYVGEDENVAAQFSHVLQTQMFDSFDMDSSPLQNSTFWYFQFIYLAVATESMLQGP